MAQVRKEGSDLMQKARYRTNLDEGGVSKDLEHHPREFRRTHAARAFDLCWICGPDLRRAMPGRQQWQLDLTRRFDASSDNRPVDLLDKVVRKPGS